MIASPEAGEETVSTRSSKRGLHAWDVDRLIALVQGLDRQWIALDAIRELDQNYWFGGRHDIPSCRAIAGHMEPVQVADLSFPIILSADGGVMDGMHRATEALLQGLDTIEMVQFEQDPAPDYSDVQPRTKGSLNKLCTGWQIRLVTAPRCKGLVLGCVHLSIFGVRVMNTSSTMTIRLESTLKARLDRLADATQRSRSFLAAEAVREFVELNEWQLEEISAAVQEADEGDFASDEETRALFSRWGVDGD